MKRARTPIFGSGSAVPEVSGNPRPGSLACDADKRHGTMPSTSPCNSSCHQLLIDLDRRFLVEQAFVDEPLVDFHQLEPMTIDVANDAA